MDRVQLRQRARVAAATAAAAAAPSGHDGDGEQGAGGGGEVSEQSLEESQRAVGDREVVFAPEKGNVLFSSAVHGWAFDLRVFAALFARKLGVRQQLLQQTLWGEYFFQPKLKKVVRSNPTGKLTPMFVQFVLQTLWQASSPPAPRSHTHAPRSRLTQALQRSRYSAGWGWL